MSFIKVFVVLGLVGGILSISSELSTNQKFENCNIASYQKKFDVLPGRGWDNLNNEDKGQILNLNFSKCLYSQDNKYLIPNDVSLIPIKVSDVELNSNSFTHYQNYTTVTAESINADARGSFYGFSFGGSFSKEKEEVKIDQIQTKSAITRVQLRYNVYKSVSEVDFELNPIFRSRIMDIAGLVLENKDSLYPKYLADMIIRDYGTHVTRSIDAGATLSKIDFLTSSYTKKYRSDSNRISASASASFGSFFGMSAKYTKSATQIEIDEYDRSSEKTKINTHGGALYGYKFSVDQWRLSVFDNLVAIDRKGDPIYYTITSKAFPELDGSTVNRVNKLVKDAMNRYFIANGRKGCLDIKAVNFNPDANIDAKNCESPKLTFQFGGTYRTCVGPGDQCNPFQQVNPLTGNFNCLSGYNSILLNNGLNRCAEYCKRYFIFWKRCHTECSYYSSFWCSPQNIKQTLLGYQFGGFLSNEMKTCPVEYFPITVGLFAQMCVSVNQDPLNLDAIKFGGFYSCKSGNPLAVNFDKSNLKSSSLLTSQFRCGKGYIGHLVNIDQGCEIVYCTETNKVSLGYLPSILRPPFISLNYNPNSTKVIVFITLKGKKYVKTVLGDWRRYESKIRENKIIAGCIIGTFFVLWMTFGVIVFLQRRFYRKKMKNIEIGLLLDPLLTNYGSIN